MAKHKGRFGGGDHSGWGGHKSGRRSGSPGCCVVLIAMIVGGLTVAGELARALV